MVDKVYTSCTLPIYRNRRSREPGRIVVEFLLVGASAVQVGTALFVEPDAPVKMVRGLRTYLKDRKLTSVTELIGKVKKVLMSCCQKTPGDSAGKQVDDLCGAGS